MHPLSPHAPARLKAKSAGSPLDALASDLEMRFGGKPFAAHAHVAAAQLMPQRGRRAMTRRGAARAA